MVVATSQPNAMGDLAIAIFRLNGRLIETGNQMVGDIGLTAALWQVLGALDRSPVPLPVAQIARNQGLTRQSVQRTVDLMTARGLVAFAPNPNHQRAKLVVMTGAGRAALDGADRRQAPWAATLAERIGKERLMAAIGVLLDVEEHIAATGGARDRTGDEVDAGADVEA